MKIQKIIKEYIDDDFYVDEMDSDIPGRRRNDYEGAYEDEIDPFEDEFGASSTFDAIDDDIDALGRSRRHRYRRFVDDAEFEPIGPDEAEEIIDDDVQAGLDGMKDEDEEDESYWDNAWKGTKRGRGKDEMDKDWWDTDAGEEEYNDDLTDISIKQNDKKGGRPYWRRRGTAKTNKGQVAKKHGKNCKCPDCCK